MKSVLTADGFGSWNPTRGIQTKIDSKLPSDIAHCLYSFMDIYLSYIDFFHQLYGSPLSIRSTISLYAISLRLQLAWVILTLVPLNN